MKEYFEEVEINLFGKKKIYQVKILKKRNSKRNCCVKYITCDDYIKQIIDFCIRIIIFINESKKVKFRKRGLKLKTKKNIRKLKKTKEGKIIDLIYLEKIILLIHLFFKTIIK